MSSERMRELLLIVRLRSACASLQGQDESDETRETLESCNALGGAIEFTSVKIDCHQGAVPLSILPVPSNVCLSRITVILYALVITVPACRRGAYLSWPSDMRAS